MRGKWFWGIIILAIVSLLLSLFGPWSATEHSKEMGQSIRNALTTNQVSNVNVEMNGNEATLSGELASQDMLDKAVNVARSTECETCKKKGKNWHTVKNDLMVKKTPAIPAVSPYVFSARKAPDTGHVILNGYVRNQEEKTRIWQEAKNMFGEANVTDRTIRTAPGAPDVHWGDVISAHMPELASLDFGGFVVEDGQVLIEGQTSSVDTRSKVNAVASGLNARFAAYNGAANIRVPQVKAENAGEVKSQSIPAVSPYVFSARKAPDTGHVILNGYVRNQEEKARIWQEAKNMFGEANVTDRTIRTAPGAPDVHWGDVISAHMPELESLDFGGFVVEDGQVLIEGQTSSVDTRSKVNAVASGLNARFAAYNGAANIRVPQAKAENAGEVKSQSICQDLLATLKKGNRINFATNSAEITGAKSFDLLNTLASAVKQCKSFRVRVEGHTDNVGKMKYNQWLSEARANSVVAYLADNDVNTSRLNAVGYGEAKAVATNDTPEGRAQNRRIEFTIQTSE